MAGKKNLDQGPMLIRGLDLDAIDDILDGRDGSGSSTKKNSPVTEFKEGFKRGMRSIRPESFVGNFMRQALPPGYSRLLGLYDETTSQIRYTIDRVEDAEAAALGELAESFEGQLEKLKGKLPDAVYQRIKTKIEDKKEGYRQTVKFKQAQNARDNEDPLASLDQAIQNELSDELAEAQIDLAKATGDVEHSKLEYEVKRDGIRAKLDKSRFNALNRSLGLIADATTRTSAFNDAITYKFQQKSLELQMRSYLALRSLVELGGRTHQLHRDAYTALVTNTGLPDFKKGTEADRTKFNAKQAVLDPFRNVVNKTAADFAHNFLGQLFNNIGSKAAGAIGAGSNMGGGLLGMLYNQLKDDPYGNAGQFAATEGVNLLAQYLMPRAAMVARPGLRRASDRLTGGLDSRLSYLIDNMQSISQDYITDTSNESGIHGYLKDALRTVLPTFRLDDLVKDNTYQTIEQAASFNQLSQRSLVEIIPGYLSRILHETRMIRTGDDSIDRETYDITRGQFTSQRVAREHLGRRVVGMGARRAVDFAMTDTLTTFDSEGELSVEARHALEERLLRDAMEGRHFDPVRYLRMEGYAPGTAPEVLDELTRFFRARFKYTEDGKLAKDITNYQRRQEYSESFGQLRTAASRPITEIERLLKSGQHEALRDLGIIHTVEGEDRINYRVLREYYRDLGEVSGEEGGAPEPPSPTSPVMTRLRRSLKDRAERVKGRMRGVSGEELKEKAAGFTEDLQYNAKLAGGYAKGAFTTGYDTLQNTAYTAADIVKAGSNAILVRADEIRSGELIDVTTQKVITSIDDIKGQVVDLAGNVRITQAEAIQGLFTTDGRKLQPVLPKLNIPTNVLSIAHQARLKAGQHLTTPNALLSRVKDLYIQGAESPVIKATALRAGEYLNAATGEVLETIDDITDSVVHISNPNEIILTKQEARDKLVDKDGKRFKSSKLWRGITSAMSLGTGIVGKAFKMGFAAMKFGVMAVGKRFMTMDAYLPGQSEPVLSAARLKRGEYYSADGKVLTSFDDLRHGVYGPDGNQILDPESVAQLVNRDGSKHTAAKKRSWLRKGVKGFFRGTRNAWWKWTKNYYKDLGKTAGGIFSKLANKSDNYLKEAITPTDSLLSRILDVLDRRLPPEEAKVGSTAWQLAQMENGQKREGTRGEGLRADARKEKTGLAGLLQGLFGRRDELEDEEDDSGGDTTVIVGGEGGGSEGREGKRRRRNKPRGRIGRAIDRVRGSKLGRGIGRVVGSRAGQGLIRGASLLGRGALLMGTGSVFSGAGAMAAGAGSVIAGTAAGIASILASPVVLGGLAVAAVAAGGYWLWKRNRNTKGDFRNLRLMQYGIKSTGDKLRVLEFEAYIEQFTNKGSNPTMNLNAAKSTEIFKIFKIDPQDSTAIMALANWLEYRFKPVYFAYIKQLDALGVKDIALNDLDEKLEDAKKYALLNGLVDIPPEAYAHHETPFDYGEATKQAYQPEEIHEEITKLKRKWKEHASEAEQKEEDEKKVEGVSPEAVARVASGTGSSASAVPTEGFSAKAVPQPEASRRQRMIPNILRKGVDLLNKHPLAIIGAKGRSLLANTPTAQLMKGLVSNVPILGSFSITKLTPLQAIRLYAYGDAELEKQHVNALLAAEARLYRNVRIDQHGQASFTGNLDEFIGHLAAGMGISTDDPEQTQRVIQWAVRRFIPVALSYFAGVHDKHPGLALSRVEASLKPEQKLEIANAIMTATYEDDGARHSIWEAVSFKADADLKGIKERAELELENLKQEIEKLKLNSPSGANAEDGAGQSRLKQLTNKLLEGAKAIGTSLRERIGSVMDRAAGVRESIGGALNRVADWAGLSRPAQPVSGSSYSTDYTPGGTVTQSGRAFIAQAEGQGGLWTQIPLPAKNKDRNAAMPTLKAVEQMTGVDANLLATFCSIESSFDYLVKAATSSATGWFQFINDTWDMMFRRHAAKYGVPSDNRARDLRKDPRVNALMGAEFLKENYRKLQEALGITPTDTDLYCAHFMGAQGAINFLKKDRNAIAASFFPKAASANRSIYYKPTGQPRTIGEVYALLDSKVEKHRRYSDQPDVGSSASEQAVTQADEAVKTIDTSDITEETRGEVAVQAPTGSSDSLTQVSDRAAGPMRMTDTTQVLIRDAIGGDRAASTATPMENPTVVDSGQHSEARVNALRMARQQAEQADKQAAERTQAEREITTTSISIQEKQLETQVQMRDLLRQIAERIKHPVGSGDAPATPTPPANTGTQQQVARERQPRNTPPPISFAR